MMKNICRKSAPSLSVKKMEKEKKSFCNKAFFLPFFRKSSSSFTKFVKSCQKNLEKYEPIKTFSLKNSSKCR